MENFSFKELDQEGLETLMAISMADKFNKWMYETILPFCKGKVLEIGSGIGNISGFFIKNNKEIVLSDIRNNYCDYLQKRFHHVENCKGVVNLDLVHPDFDTIYSGWMSGFDTVFALNVVEHIQDDELAIRNAKKLLRQGGNLIILVPAYNLLYNRFDKELEHYRRYTQKSLRNLISPHLKIISAQYFNSIGIPGWFISGKLLGNKIIPANQMKLYNRMVPVFKILDKLLFNKIGLSVVVVGQKTEK